MLGSGKYRLIFNIKLNKIKYITLVGAPRAPKKEPNAGIGEIISPIESATYPASHSLSFFLFTSPNFLYISTIKSFIIFIPLLSFLTSSLALPFFKKVLRAGELNSGHRFFLLLNFRIHLLHVLFNYQHLYIKYISYLYLL